MSRGVRRAVWWRVVVGSGLAAGAVRWRLRPSAVAFSGSVLVVGFGCFARAVRFARLWALWCGVPVAVRVRVSGGARVWAVSVPVSAPVGAGGGGSAAGPVVWWAVPR